MGIKIESNFNFDDKVKIKPLNVEGKIASFWLRRSDWLLVEVRYFINNDMKTEYFFEDELEVVKEQKTGF